jgi:tetratricopeptide (TPR) repeat protein
VVFPLGAVLLCFAGGAGAWAQAPNQSPNQTPAGQQGAQPATPGASPAGDNPFPGEAADVPVIPVDPAPGASKAAAAGQPPAEAESAPGGKADPDGDPVRSPDAAGGAEGDGFSSSRQGLNATSAEPDADAAPRKDGKAKTRGQVVKDNLDVGEFYLEKKNWKAAQSRFQDAFTLDSESPDALWGMAEAERHLELLDKAREHYQLFLAYDPEGPHGKAARKALEELERDHPVKTAAPSPPVIPR